MKVLNVFIKNGIILTISSIILKTISIIFNIFLSNKISSSDLGSWSIIMSIFSFLLTVSLSGVNLSSTRLVAKEHSYGNVGNIKIIIRDCLKYCLFFSILSILLLLSFKNYIFNVISEKSIDIKLIYLLSLTLPFCSISSCLNGYFMAVEKMKPIIISQTIEVISQILISVIFYNLGFFSTTYNICFTLILSLLISDFLSFIYLIKVYSKDNKIYKKIKATQKNFKKNVIKISLPVALTSYIKSGLSTLKTTLIPVAFMAHGYSYNDSLGYYGLISGTVLTLILFPFTFLQSYNSLLVPKISSYDPKKSIKKIKKIAIQSLSLTFLFGLIITIFFTLTANKIDQKFYKTLDVEYYIKVLAPIIIYIYMDNIVDSLLKSLDAQIYVVIINIVDLCLTILLIKYFIPIFGISAYILILYSSEIFNFYTSLFILCKKIKNFSNKSL